LIARAAETGKPLIIATGMSSIEEVTHAVQVAKACGARQVALLHAVSAHPVPPGSENLRAIRTLADRFHVPVGFSDHADDTFALPMAMALGASIYERHLVLPDDLHAVDIAVSSLPDELSEAINQARRAHHALGTGEKICLEAEMMNRHIHRRALCATHDLEPGMVLRRMDLVALRPANGLAPSRLDDITGRRLVNPLDLGQPIREHDIEARDRHDFGRPHAV
jgi:sialic acid synthase SpsE